MNTQQVSDAARAVLALAAEIGDAVPTCPWCNKGMEVIGDEGLTERFCVECAERTLDELVVMNPAYGFYVYVEEWQWFQSNTYGMVVPRSVPAF